MQKKTLNRYLDSPVYAYYFYDIGIVIVNDVSKDKTLKKSFQASDGYVQKE